MTKPKFLHLILLTTILAMPACGSNYDLEELLPAESRVLSLDDDEIAFVHVTDIHGGHVSLQLANYYLNETSAMFGLVTGDIISKPRTILRLSQTKKPFLCIPGNHDACRVYNGSVGEFGFRTYFLKAIGQEKNAIFSDNTCNYWYQDFECFNHTLRVIGLDQFQLQSIKQKDDDWSFQCVYTQEQIDWLIDLLEHSDTVDGIIIAIHCGFGNKDNGARDVTQTGDFTSLLASYDDKGYDYYGKYNTMMIPDIINAYQTGENLTEKKYMNSVVMKDTISVTTHFNRPSNNFIAYLGGHLHYDVVEHLPKYPRQLQVLLTYCGDGKSCEYDDLVRDGDTESYCFNVNIINFKKRELKLVRKGAHLKMDGTKRDSISFTY